MHSAPICHQDKNTFHYKNYLSLIVFLLIKDSPVTTRSTDPEPLLVASTLWPESTVYTHQYGPMSFTDKFLMRISTLGNSPSIWTLAAILSIMIFFWGLAFVVEKIWVLSRPFLTSRESWSEAFLHWMVIDSPTFFHTTAFVSAHTRHKNHRLK